MAYVSVCVCCVSVCVGVVGSADGLLPPLPRARCQPIQVQCRTALCMLYVSPYVCLSVLCMCVSVFVCVYVRLVSRTRTWVCIPKRLWRRAICLCATCGMFVRLSVFQVQIFSVILVCFFVICHST